MTSRTPLHAALDTLRAAVREAEQVLATLTPTVATPYEKESHHAR